MWLLVNQHFAWSMINEGIKYSRRQFGYALCVKQLLDVSVVNKQTRCGISQLLIKKKQETRCSASKQWLSHMNFIANLSRLTDRM